jgi:hypothetical protein
MLCERKMNIKLAQRNSERGNHFVFLPKRERELNIVRDIFPSGNYPIFISKET